MREHWAFSWMQISSVRDILAFKMPLECNEVSENDVERDNSLNAPELGRASRCGQAAIVWKLLSSSADPNACDAWGQTPLFHAASNGNVLVVASLMLARADPTRTSDGGLSPLDVVTNRQAQTLMCALAPLSSRRVSNVLELDKALEALPGELRDRFEEAVGTRERKLAI
mmetsp:Transcript_98272/g.194687  ORF Transcript_98272/g.194687 Transcript_98272/m.194687 type:complete len:170 (+) Transcript_98272:52-561(+)